MKYMMSPSFTYENMKQYCFFVRKFLWSSFSYSYIRLCYGIIRLFVVPLNAFYVVYLLHVKHIQFYTHTYKHAYLPIFSPWARMQQCIHMTKCRLLLNPFNNPSHFLTVGMLFSCLLVRLILIIYVCMYVR